jgi:hypothetical protein
MPQRQISPERKAIFYIGLAVAAIGFLCFISVFISDALNFGDFTDFKERNRSEGIRAVLGMLMIVAGFIIALIGRRGLAGVGLKLDPEEARRDVEPWARMSGGILKDTLDEAGIELGRQPPGEGLPFDERLRRLQKLRDEKLISEQEYQITKKKILESA